MTDLLDRRPGSDLMDGPCARCGLAHERCVGHRKDGKPCGRWPIKGGSVCVKHGAGAPQVKAAARRRLANAEAMASLAEVEVVPIGDPLDALSELAAEAWAWKGHLGDMVAGLRDQYRFVDEDKTGRRTEQLDARVALFERAMDRCQKFLADWVKLGFEKRKVRVDEIRAGLLAVAIAGVLRELGHDPEADVVLRVLDRWLPVLDGAPAPVLEVKEA